MTNKLNISYSLKYEKQKTVFSELFCYRFHKASSFFKLIKLHKLKNDVNKLKPFLMGKNKIIRPWIYDIYRF